MKPPWTFRKFAWAAAAAGLAVAVGFCDYITGTEISFGVFYLVPVAVAAWQCGLGAGLVVAIECAALWFAGERLWNQPHSSPLILYWNAFARFGVFTVTVILICRTKRLNSFLRDKADSLAREIVERSRAEAALAESQRLFRLIAENA